MCGIQLCSKGIADYKSTVSIRLGSVASPCKEKGLLQHILRKLGPQMMLEAHELSTWLEGKNMGCGLAVVCCLSPSPSLQDKPQGDLPG